MLAYTENDPAAVIDAGVTVTDTETGQVRVCKLVAAHAIGRIVNPPQPLDLGELARQAGVPAEVGVYAKAEWFNPGGSVKDRAALRIVQDGTVG